MTATEPKPVEKSPSYTRFLPLVVFLSIGLLFTVLLLDKDRDPSLIKSALIGKAVPAGIDLPALYAGQQGLSTAALKQDKPIIVNFFASWCVPCRAEHRYLTALAARGDAYVYGIAYKDTVKAAQKFLKELGNPYSRVAIDKDGFGAAIDFGITGVPETFIINTSGMITYRFTGPIVTDQALAKVITEVEQAQ